MRFFNTAGPVNPADHYCLPPLERVNLAEMIELIAQKKYFILHAPRQVGKTTMLLALMEYLNREGRYRCLYMNVEAVTCHWRSQGKPIEAYQLLAPIYNWFTEGFDTPDLIEAKQLLAEVATAIR